MGPDDRFEVVTADTVAAVKGTEYEVEVNDLGTDLRVNAGTVWLDDLDHSHHSVVGAHMAGRCERHGLLHDPRSMTRDEIRHFGEWAHENVSPHRRGLSAADQAKQAAWAKLRPDQRAKVLADLKSQPGGCLGRRGRPLRRGAPRALARPLA